MTCMTLSSTAPVSGYGLALAAALHDPARVALSQVALFHLVLLGLIRDQHHVMLSCTMQFVGLGASDVGRERVELKDAFAKLHASLSLGAVPESLPCRDEERKRLGGYLKRALNEGAWWLLQGWVVDWFACLLAVSMTLAPSSLLLEM